jgi:DNA-binding NarL/FixJ family response regulator
MNKIRVLLVDDHVLFREALRLLLEGQADIEIVGEAANGSEVADLVSGLKPSIVLMDIHMAVMDGIQATRVVKRKHPTVGIIILMMYSHDEYVLEALKAGAKAYLSKDSSSEQLLHVIRSVHQGQAVVDPEIMIRLLGKMRRMDNEDKKYTFARPSDLEVQILTLVATGATNQDIAQALQVTEPAVKKRISTILKKLGVANRTEAVMRAMRMGLIR